MKISVTIEGEAGRIEVTCNDDRVYFTQATGYSMVIDSVVGNAKFAYKELSKNKLSEESK